MENQTKLTTKNKVSFQQILPSIICTDLCNLERSVQDLKSLGLVILHVDLIDGYFSPSMPIGLDMLKQIKNRTAIDFDIHLMVNDNAFFVDELIKLKAKRICFHGENRRDTITILKKIKSKGIQAGLALDLATPISSLNYVIEECDYILNMCINPGYAHMMNEKKSPITTRKLNDLFILIKTIKPSVTVTVDGRVGFDDFIPYLEVGVSNFVVGTSSLFHKSNSLENNWSHIKLIFDRYSKNLQE